MAERFHSQPVASIPAVQERSTRPSSALIMASTVPQKRKLSDVQGATSSRPFAEGVSVTEECPRREPYPPNDQQPSILEPGERTRNTHQGATATDNARMHNGDIHVHAGNVNYMCEHGGGSAEHDRSKAFMEALAFPLMERRLASIRPATGRTCRWILAKPGCLKWLESSARSSRNDLFWIKGKAGAGKSTLMRCILESARERMPGSHVISFFFNAKGVQLEHSVEGMFRSLLCQIFEKIPRLRQLISIPRSFHKGQNWEPETLRDIFRTAVLEIREEKLVCLVDALDETPEEDARQLVEFFEDLLEETQSQNSAVKMCFASRLFPHISAKACQELVVENQDEHLHDIKFYISSRLRIGPGKFRDALEHTISKKSRGVFLWVVLVVERTNKQFDGGVSEDQVIQILDTVPEDLSSLFGAIVSQGALDDRFAPTLIWMLVKNHEMTINELYDAIRLSSNRLTIGDPNFLSLDDVDLRRNEADLRSRERFIIDSSKGLLTVSCPFGLGSRNTLTQVEFIHESVREHILRGGLVKLCQRLRGNVESVCRAMVAEWCQLYVRLRCQQLAAPANRSTEISKIRQHRLWAEDKDRDLASYVLERTFYHMKIAYLGGDLAVTSLNTFPLSEWIYVLNEDPSIRTCISFRKDPYRRPILEASASLLYLLLEWGSMPLAQALLDSYVVTWSAGIRSSTDPDLSLEVHDSISSEQELNAPCGGTWGSVLHAAAAHGSRKMVQSLLDHGADIHSHGIPGDLGPPFSSRERILSSVLATGRSRDSFT